MKRKPSIYGKATRERLVKVATRLFAKSGFEGVSVRDIVKEAGANLGAVTYHFGGKEALFAEVLTRKTLVLLREGEELVKSSLPPDEKLRALLERFAMHIMHEDPGFKVFVAEMMAGGARLPKATIEALEWRNRVFTEIVQEGVQKGIFRPFNGETLSWFYFGMMSPFILYPLLTGRKGRDNPYPREYVKAVVDEAVNVFMNGLKLPKEGPEARTV